MRKSCAALALSSLVVLVVQSALATTSYPDYVGTNITFSGIKETSTFGDPEPLFEAPTGVGDSLLFSPTNFTATASGVGGNDSTGALLNATMTATSLSTIDMLNFTEFGDATLTGAPSAGTGVFTSLAGYVRVLEVNGLPITPVTIGFNAGAGTNGSFSPAAIGSTGLDRNTNPGTTLWSGTLSVDIAAALVLAGYAPQATKVELALDNDLYAYSEFASNTAKVQKKAVTGPTIVITVIPEPGTAVLLGLGLVAVTVRARHRQS